LERSGMTFLSESVLDLDRAFRRETVEYTATKGMPTGLTPAVTGDSVVSAVGYDNAYGSAIKVAMGASGTASLTGPTIGTGVAAALIELEGVSHADLAAGEKVQWECGLNNGSNKWAYLRTGTFGAVLENYDGTTQTQAYCLSNDPDAVTDYDAGVLVNFSKGETLGHFGHSYCRNAVVPNAATSLKFTTATGGAAYYGFSVYIRKILLHVWR
jgi:hypothetical protein